MLLKLLGGILGSWRRQKTKKHPKAWGTPGVLAILLTYFMKSALEWATLK
ncbi:hypothetical protein M2419_000673 [Sphingobacterium sp. BIGb0116]|nr:hypothetical protein [Sphingobacterium sp. BIGb0116]